MGTDKALVPVEGRPMAARVAAAVAAAGCEEVVAIGGDEARLTALGLEVIADRVPGGGPVPALATAASVALDRGAERLVVAGCDHPWLDATTVRALLEPLDAPAGIPTSDPPPVAVPATRSWPPALVLAARSAELAVAASRMKPGTALADLLAGMRIARVAVAEVAAVADVDRPEHLYR